MNSRLMDYPLKKQVHFNKKECSFKKHFNLLYIPKAFRSRVKETIAVRLPFASKKERTYKNFEKEST